MTVYFIIIFSHPIPAIAGTSHSQRGKNVAFIITYPIVYLFSDVLLSPSTLLSLSYLSLFTIFTVLIYQCLPSPRLLSGFGPEVMMRGHCPMSLCSQDEAREAKWLMSKIYEKYPKRYLGTVNRLAVRSNPYHG